MAIYDRRGRLAMSQNGKQRANNEWSFTKYDVFDRPVLSGIITGGTYESHKAALDAATVFYEERDTTVHGYTNQSYPSVPNANSYLTVTYYDDYDWLAANDPHAFSAADALGQTHTTDVIGLTTGVKKRYWESRLINGSQQSPITTKSTRQYRPFQTCTPLEQRLPPIRTIFWATLRRPKSNRVSEVPHMHITSGSIMTTLGDCCRFNNRSPVMLPMGRSHWLHTPMTT